MPVTPDPGERRSQPTQGPSVAIADSRFHGSVKWFNAASGYGYIVADEGDEELFVHQADLADDLLGRLESGDRVAFEQRGGGMGPQAINVAAIAA